MEAQVIRRLREMLGRRGQERRGDGGEHRGGLDAVFDGDVGTVPRLADLERRLAAFLGAVDRTGKPLTAGAVQLIGLATIRERLGEKWERFAGRVHGLARHVIERHLSETDVYALYRDDSYLVLFPELSETQAQFKAKVIADEISRQILGTTDEAHGVTVKTAITEVDGSVAFAETDDDALMARLFAEAQRQLDADEADEAAPEPGPPPAAAAPQPSPPALELSYRPIWNVRKNIVSGFYAIPNRRGAQPSSPPPATRDVDCFVLQRVIEELRGIARGAPKKILVAPVHFTTLAVRQSSKAYFDLCHWIPEPCRDYVVFEVIVPAEGGIFSRLDDVATRLRVFARSLLCRAHLGFERFDALGSMRFLAVGAALPAGRAAEGPLMRAFDVFARRAESHQIHAYLHDVPSLSLMTAAIAAGFEYLDGEPVGSLMRTQLGCYRFSLMDLYLPRVEQR